MFPRICLVAAISKDGVIGVNNKIPWVLPRELKLFKAITTNKKYLLERNIDYTETDLSAHPSVVMGRKTFESIGRPLPGRVNVIITSKPPISLINAARESSGAIVIANSVEEAISTTNSTCYVIGGGNIYREFLNKNYCGQLLLSHLSLSVLPATHKTDSIVFMPIFDRKQYLFKSILESSPEFTLKLYQNAEISDTHHSI